MDIRWIAEGAGTGPGALRSAWRSPRPRSPARPTHMVLLTISVKAKLGTPPNTFRRLYVFNLYRSSCSTLMMSAQCYSDRKIKRGDDRVLVVLRNQTPLVVNPRLLSNSNRYQTPLVVEPRSLSNPTPYQLPIVRVVLRDQTPLAPSIHMG